MHKQSFSKIWIGVILVVLFAGGIFAWQYFGVPKEEVKVLEEKVVPAEEGVKPFITVLSPNGGEILTLGEIHTIKWETSPQYGSERMVAIYLIKKGASELEGKIITKTPNTGSYDWYVNVVGVGAGEIITPGEYKLRLSIPENGGVVVDRSDNYFSIVELVPEERDILFHILESDKKLSEYLIENTDLLEGTEFTFIRTDESIAFFTFHPWEMANRGIIQIKENNGFLVLLEDDPCYCFGVRDLYTKRIAYNQPEFIISSFTPLSGTCVAIDVFRISKIFENKFKEVWSSFTWQCPGYGSVSESWTCDVATIEFKDLDNDNNFEIIKKGHTIKCGDKTCFCTEGPKKLDSEFQQIFTWNERVKNFIEKVE